MSYSEANLKQAHRHSLRNREELRASQICGCFYCRNTFAPDQILRWIDEGGGTALCPLCGIDSVIGEASGYPVADPSFLSDMHDLWFLRSHATRDEGGMETLTQGVQEQAEPFQHDAEDDFRRHFTPDQIAAIEAGLADARAGRTVSNKEMFAQLRAKYGW